jgi:hypothetical protein
MASLPIAELFILKSSHTSDLLLLVIDGASLALPRFPVAGIGLGLFGNTSHRTSAHAVQEITITIGL